MSSSGQFSGDREGENAGMIVDVTLNV